MTRREGRAGTEAWHGRVAPKKTYKFMQKRQKKRDEYEAEQAREGQRERERGEKENGDRGGGAWEIMLCMLNADGHENNT